MRKMLIIAGVIGMVAASAQAGLIYKVQVKTQTDTSVPNDLVVAGAASTGAGGGFGSDLSDDPLVNGTEVSHAFSFLDAANNVNWGFTLTMTGSANIDGSGSGIGVNDTNMDTGESATFALSGLYATANNAGESVDSYSMLISGLFNNGLDVGESYDLTGGGSTVTITTANTSDLGANSDTSIFVDNYVGSMKPNKLGVTADINVVPEPATIGMLGLGALISLLVRRYTSR